MPDLEEMTAPQLAERLARRLLDAQPFDEPAMVRISPGLEVLIAIFFQGSIALGEHCFWQGNILSQATWYDLCSDWERRLLPYVTADRDVCPHAPWDLIEVRPGQPALFYQNTDSDGRIGLTEQGRLMVRHLIALALRGAVCLKSGQGSNDDPPVDLNSSTAPGQPQQSRPGPIHTVHLDKDLNMPIRTLVLHLDPDDYRDVTKAIQLRQEIFKASNQGDDLLPDGHGNLAARYLGEVCRGWMEYVEPFSPPKSDQSNQTASPSGNR